MFRSDSTKETLSKSALIEKLPYWATPQAKVPVIAAAATFFNGVYMMTNHYHFFQPRLLDMYWIDHATPLVIESVWVYLSAYLMIILAYIWIEDEVNLNRMLYGFLSTTVICGAIFWAWPTTYPRMNFPINATPTTWSEYAFGMFRTIDTPANCLPSMHVAGSYLAAFAFIHEQRRKFPWMFLWATAIWISTLTTKQHYWIDGLAGLTVAFLVQRFFTKQIPGLSKKA